MPENVSERDLLIESLPLGAGNAEWAAFEAHVLGQTPTCPPTVQLIELARNLLADDVAGEVKRHVDSCRHCRVWYLGFMCGADDPRTASVQRLRQLDEAATVPDEQPEQVAVWAAGMQWGDQPAPLPTGTFISTLMRARDPQDLIEKLHPVLPELLGDVGLAPTLTDSFVRFVSARTKDPQFVAVGLPGWLERFTREELGLGGLPCRLSADDWNGILMQGALRYLSLYPPVEAEEDRQSASSVYRLALEKGINSWQVAFQELKLLATRVGLTDVAVSKLLKAGRDYHRTLFHRLGPRPGLA